MTRKGRFALVFAAALLAAQGAARAGDEKPKLMPVAPSEASGFFKSYLVPRMAARLGDERAIVATDFGNPAANPWTRDEGTEDRVRRGAIRATKSAVKRYAMERLNVDAWSLPLVSSGKARGLAAFKTESGGPRLRFGFSHLAPRAEVILPAAAGRYTVNADAFGRVGASFERPGGSVKAGIYLDPREGNATFGLNFAF